jgi:tetratricopeptide (TPR) repeat protein
MPPAPHQESRPVVVTAEEHFTRGVQLLKAERLSEAQDALIQARFGPLAPRATALLAYCSARRGQTRDGVALSHLALSAGHDQAAVRNNLGYCLLESGKVAEALPQLEEAIRQDSTLRQAYYNRALARYLRDLSPDHTLPDRAAADDMRKALANGVLTTQACLEAAQVFAATRPIAPELTADAIRCLVDAVRIGADPSDIARTAVLRTHLGDHPEFQRLCAAPRHPLTEPPGAYLRFRLIAPE